MAGEPYLERLISTIPDGTIIGARGTSGVFAPESELNTWLRTIYFKKENRIQHILLIVWQKQF